MSSVRTLILPSGDPDASALLANLFSTAPGTAPTLVDGDGETLAFVIADPSYSVERAYDARAIPSGTTAKLALGNAQTGTLYAEQDTFAPLPNAGYTVTQIQTGNPSRPAIVEIALLPTPYGGTWTVDGLALNWSASETEVAAQLTGSTVQKTGTFTWRLTGKANGAYAPVVNVSGLLVLTGLQFTLDLSNATALARDFGAAGTDQLTAQLTLQVTFPGALPGTVYLAPVTVAYSVLSLAVVPGGVYEPVLGAPASDNSILVSLVNKTRSWLATTSFGRSLLGLADATAARNTLGLGTAVRDYTGEATSAVSQRIAGKSASPATLAIFSAANDSTHVYTRNPGLWCADLDLTCISVCTGTGGGGANAGWRITMITPLHGISAHHISVSVGTVGYWVDNNNVTYTRTVTAVTNVAGDLDLVTLNASLPASITPALVLPSTIPAGFSSGTGSLIGCPVITHTQNRRLCIANLAGLYLNNGVYPLYDVLSLPTTGAYTGWNRAADTAGATTPGITYDSSSPYFMVIGGRPVILGCFSTTAGTGPDPGASYSALQAAIAGSATLLSAMMPGYPGGAAGPAGTVTVGTVTTGAAGSSASVTNSGTSTAAVLNFLLPKGDAGSPAGLTTLSVGSVDTLAPGSPATAALSNEGSGNYTLSFGIPQGASESSPGIHLDPYANADAKTAGYINTADGGSGSTPGGYIDTGAGGYINTSNGGGFIDTCGAYSGHIQTNGDSATITAGGSINTSAADGYDGGSINTSGGGSIVTHAGGSILTSDGGGNIYTNNLGGDIDTSNGGGHVLTKAVPFSGRRGAPGAPPEGTFQPFTDSTTNTWGATITGGGSNHVLGYYDGTNWTVMAK